MRRASFGAVLPPRRPPLPLSAQPRSSTASIEMREDGGVGTTSAQSAIEEDAFDAEKSLFSRVWPL